MRTDFAILERPWWHDCNVRGDPLDSASLICDAADCISTLREFFAGNSDMCLGYMDLHRIRYVRDCIIGEGCYDRLTITDIEDVLGGRGLGNGNQASLTVNHDQVTQRKYDLSRLEKKIFNLNSAYSGKLFYLASHTRLTVELVKDVHAQVGRGIIQDAGHFRKSDARPSGEPCHMYTTPEMIEPALNRLLENVPVLRTLNGSRYAILENAIKLGACFLSEFLHIHPFSNGNGRTARLLTSALLASYTAGVPLSLCTVGSSRETYLQCLRETRPGFAEHEKPSSLSRFLLENLHSQLTDAKFLLDL